MSGNSSSRAGDRFKNLHIERSGSTVGDSAADGTSESEAGVLEARIGSVKAWYFQGSQHTRLRALISSLGATGTAILINVR